MICSRVLGSARISQHHLIPKTFKGDETITIHDICHSKLHATFSEREMLHTFNTVEAILSHDEIAKFVKWVQNKDPSFYNKNDDTKKRYGKRKNAK